MNLGFYYHIEVEVKDGFIFLPGFLGVFIDSLAKEVSELHCFFHTTDQEDRVSREYNVKANNIELVDLGDKPSFLKRLLFPGKVIGAYKTQIASCDKLLVRGPTPLLPYFSRYINSSKLGFLLVGDYVQSCREANNPILKKTVLMTGMRTYEFLQNRALKKSLVLVNSERLFQRYSRLHDRVHLIKTTTLNNNDFYQRVDTCLNKKYRLLYTGRFDWAKGLKELFNAFLKLKKKHKQMELHFVGWQDDNKTNVIDTIEQLTLNNDMGTSVFFHGKKNVGIELNEMYRMADIYVLPSYSEGFPRTIWEAMANSLPVITTHVGAIPDYLKNRHEAIIIEPKNVESLVNAIEDIINDKILRQKCISNGYTLAAQNTLEIQTKKLMKNINK